MLNNNEQITMIELKKLILLKYPEFNNEIKDAINNVKKENYVNYFNYAYKKENLKPYTMKRSTLLENLKYIKQHKNITYIL